MKNFLNNKSIFITGGTGSFGKHLTQKLLKNYMSRDTPYNGLLIWHGVGVGIRVILYGNSRSLMQ